MVDSYGYRFMFAKERIPEGENYGKNNSNDLSLGDIGLGVVPKKY